MHPPLYTMINFKLNMSIRFYQIIFRITIKRIITKILTEYDENVLHKILIRIFVSLSYEQSFVMFALPYFWEVYLRPYLLFVNTYYLNDKNVQSH